MNKQAIYSKPIAILFFCIFCLNAHCQQSIFNLDFQSADFLLFQWHTTQIPILKIDSTRLIQGKYPLVILPEEKQHSFYSSLYDNNPILLNLHQTFQIPEKYANDTATFSLRIRPVGMNNIFFLVRGMNYHQELLRTSSVNVSYDDEWQTVRCSLPLKDVRYLTAGIVGHSKRKGQYDYMPSKVYLDRMTVYVAGQTIEQICSDNPLPMERQERLSSLTYTNVFDEPDKSIMQKTGLQDKKIIALGETVHGSTTINENAFRIIKNSILHDSCRLVLLETDMGYGLKMNLYIHGKSPESSIKELMHDMDGYLMNLPTLENFLTWLRDYNTTATTKVNLMGMEGIYDSSVNGLFDYMYTFYDGVDKNLFYPILIGLKELEYEYVYDMIVQNEKRLTELMGCHEYGLLVDVLKGIVLAYNDAIMYGVYFHVRLNRDLYLYYNARNFIDKLLKKDEKAIIYTHYGHAQKKESIEGTFPYLRTMGNRLSERYKDDYAVIALTVGSGKIQTRYLQNVDSIYAYQLDTLPDYLLESVLMENARDSIFIPVQTLGDSVYYIRSIGSTPHWIRNYEYTNLYTCTNGVIYFKNSIAGENARSSDHRRIYKYRQRNKILNSIIPFNYGKQRENSSPETKP